MVMITQGKRVFKYEESEWQKSRGKIHEVDKDEEEEKRDSRQTGTGECDANPSPDKKLHHYWPTFPIVTKVNLISRLIYPSKIKYKVVASS